MIYISLELYFLPKKWKTLCGDILLILWHFKELPLFMARLCRANRWQRNFQMTLHKGDGKQAKSRGK